MLSRSRQSTDSEQGWALVLTLIMITLVISLGLATFAFVGNQQRMSARERQSEEAFNMAEALLNDQSYLLSSAWPGTSAVAYPDCTSATTNSSCPDPTAIGRTFNSPDFTRGASWTVKVRDNGTYNSKSYASFYGDELTTLAPSWDANGDHEVWVRAQAIVRGTRRTTVAMVKLDTELESIPHNPMLMGHFATSNSGKKVIIDTKGPSAQASPMVVRCASPVPPATVDTSCVGIDPNKGQVSPPLIQAGDTSTTALSPDSLARLRQTAKTMGTYYTNCPARPDGKLVFVEQGDCTYGNSVAPCCNSVSSPGIFIVVNGSISLSGNIIFVGVVYAANAQNSSGFLVNTGGTSAIEGAVYVDGPGGMLASSSGASGLGGANIVYDDRVYNSLTTLLNAGIVQNTFREINGS